jgi:hypothetical protein
LVCKRTCRATAGILPRSRHQVLEKLLHEISFADGLRYIGLAISQARGPNAGAWQAEGIGPGDPAGEDFA